LFIIATNDMDDNLDMVRLLSSYKAQQNVENGFRFLKSPNFINQCHLPQKAQTH
jgi:transposase